MYGVACLSSAHASANPKRDQVKEQSSGSRVSQFTQPWPVLQKKFFPTLKESRHRVFHSSQRRHGSDGLGHEFATKNAENSTAMVRRCILSTQPLLFSHPGFPLLLKCSSIVQKAGAVLTPLHFYRVHSISKLLGTSYLHREPLFGSVTENAESVVQDFLGGVDMNTALRHSGTKIASQTPGRRQPPAYPDYSPSAGTIWCQSQRR